VIEPSVEILPAVLASDFPVPAIIASAGDKASEHFLAFFAATIRNKNTRAAYVTAVAQFCGWCQDNGLQLAGVRPLHVAAYIESKKMSAPSIKQHLATLRGLFNCSSLSKSSLKIRRSSSKGRSSAVRSA
jgi:hypothetical protein